MYEVTLSQVDINEKKINKCVREWLSVAKSLLPVVLCGSLGKWGVFLVEEYNMANLRLQSMLYAYKGAVNQENAQEVQT